MKTVLLLFSTVFVALMLLSYPDMAMTQDLGRHLKLGEIITSCTCVPKENLFSYTEPHHPFINHHWFPEVVFYKLNTLGGFSALIWFKVFAITGSLIVVWDSARRLVNPLIATIVTIFLTFIFSERFDTRPEVFSFVILSIDIWLIYQHKQTQKMWYLLPIPLLQLLWVNSHIYFPVGIGLVGLLVMEGLVKKKQVWHLLVVFFCTVLATVINPNGVIGAWYPLHIFNNYGYSIVENQNIFFLNTFFFNPRILLFEVFVIGIIVLSLVRLKHHDLFGLGVSLFALISGFVMIRNFSLVALLCVPYAAVLLYSVLERQKRFDGYELQRAGYILVSLLLIAVFIARSSYSYPSFRYAPASEGAVKFIQENRIHGPIFNNFDIGSHLIYELYPQEKVFIDGRPEAYSVEFINEYKYMQEDPAIFSRNVQTYNINTIVFAHTDITPWAQTFLQWISKRAEWVPVYVDEKMVVFLLNKPENKRIIESHQITLQ